MAYTIKSIIVIEKYFQKDLNINVEREKHKRYVAQIVLRWLIKRNIVVIPKSVHKERIEENFDVFDFELNKDDIDLDSGKSIFISHQRP